VNRFFGLLITTALSVTPAVAFAQQKAASTPAPAGGADAETSKESKASGGAAAGGPQEAAVQPLDDRIKSVQGKKFLKRLRAEIYPFVGVSLNDAFYRYYHVGAAGTFHVFEGLAFELGFSGAPVRQVLEPVIFLRQNKSAIPEVARYFGNVWGNVQLSPIYGKMSLFSEWIIHYDVFALAGLGAAFDSAVTYIHPQAHVGVGSRVFLFDWLVLRGDLRGSMYPQGFIGISNLQSQVTAMFGLGVYIPPFFTSDSPGRK